MKDSLITLSDPHSPAAEAFRTLRTNVIFAGLEKPLNTLLVTSPAAEADKSLALANLAVVLAQGGRTTILVDCDLRRPRQHEIFGVAAAPGFSEWMTRTETEAALTLVSSGVVGLQLLPAGATSANPADLLTSRRLELLIAQLKTQAEFVLFDAPPLLAVSDAALLAANLEGAVLVVSAGATRREHVQRAKEMLEKIKVRVVGAVLTNTSPEGGLARY
jgi:non-specific protein-tyrosine kinase